MSFFRLVGLALVLHELVYVSSRGFGHFRDGTAPVFGLHCPPSVRVLTHIATLGVGFGLTFLPEHRSLQVVSVLVVTLLCLIFPRRLPNHMPVILTLLIAVVVAGASNEGEGIARGAAQAVFSLTYALAGLHKLNSAFFTRGISCGEGLLAEYLVRRQWASRIPSPAIFLAGTYAVVILEITISIAVWFELTRIPALFVALGLQVSFGVIGHAQFAVVMMGCTLAFVTVDVDPQFPSALFASICLLAVPATALLSIHRYFKVPIIAWCNTAVVLACGIAVGTMILMFGTESSWPNASGSTAILALLLVFVINGLAPYLGFKFDFSLAMFSNLQPGFSNHYLFRLPRASLQPRYLRLTQVVGETRGGEWELLTVNFAGWRTHAYSVPYVLGVSRQNDSFTIAAIGAIGEEWTFCGGRANRRVLGRERISVYPFALPSAPTVPLCQ